MKHLSFANMLKNYLIVVLFLFSSYTSAVEVKNIYSAKVSVKSQTAKERNQALKNAMQAVIIKVAGQQVKDPIISQEIRNFSQYVNQYQYQRLEEQTLLEVSFNEDKINALFKQANLPIWGRLRPEVMLWLVDENGLTRNIVSATSSSPLPALVREFSQTRGLPLVMPLMDLSDINALSIADLWGRFARPVARASQRYFADAAVIIRVSNNSLVDQQNDEGDCLSLCQQQGVVLDWSLMPDLQSEHGQTFSRKYQGDNAAQLLTLALSDVVDNIVQQYALTSSSNNQYTLDVANINSLTGLIEVSEFIAQLSAVQSVQLIGANGSNRRFKLELNGSHQALLASLKLTSQLQQYRDPLAGPDQAHDVPVFYWGKK